GLRRSPAPGIASRVLGVPLVAADAPFDSQLRCMNRLRMLRLAMRRKAPTPLGAFARGLVAGAIGAGAQSLFFALTKKWQPEPTHLPPELGKPEPQAQQETSLETVSRRLVDDMMQRGPIGDEEKSRTASMIHYL